MTRAKKTDVPAKKPAKPVVRCAIYTRKSTEERLDLEFNSLDAQRDSAMAYIASQRSEGWVVVDEQYDDGGFSGGNHHQGKFRVEVSRYLANSQYTGNSAKAWYLLADPNDLPVIEVAFLNGQESPTIETADADFSVLGVKMRGYHDFGCSLVDTRGGVKVTPESGPETSEDAAAAQASEAGQDGDALSLPGGDA